MEDEKQPRDRLREVRSARGLTRTEVAAALGVPVFEVERVEAGEHVRYDMVLRLSVILDTAPRELFPRAAELFDTLPDLQDLDALTAESTQKEFAKVGIDTDPPQWLLKVRLRGGVTRVFPITSWTRTHFFSAIQEQKRKPRDLQFFVINSDRYAVALNLDCVTFAHVLFEPAQYRRDFEFPEQVLVYIRGSREALEFDVDPDPEDEDEDENDERRQFQGLLFDLDSQPFMPDRFVWFDDVDGETVVLNLRTLALIEIPLWVVTPMNVDEEMEQSRRPIQSKPGEG